ncbi:TetR/AcrR family transcriptional regulator C-terminal domain-containing protein [Neofamilia massiliensis]|uniref:TetR/AcrR family transcriptional regulator C-terminal domain-containing protein n=1 Tax=Neofamilia massiliensis TaxID=1673724 RepID=UPI0006BB7A85|nr:TetR/AcrR family transcriptional regulator C-terminal domain-containing protein [Neofamilia massiliensis]
MSQNYTKDLIRKEFINLLNKKPIHSVTVTELAKKCQIERKTFYYHYENLTELVKEIFEEELAVVIEEFNETLSWEDSFILAAKFILDNKKAIKHMYESDYKADVEKYVFSIAGEIMNKYVSLVAKETKAKDIDIKLIAYFYQCALSSSLIQWVASGMKTDPVALTNRIGKLMDGNILLSLKRSEDLKDFTQNLNIE